MTSLPRFSPQRSVGGSAGGAGEGGGSRPLLLDPCGDAASIVGRVRRADSRNLRRECGGGLIGDSGVR